MSSKKMIQVNPAFLSLSKKNKSKKEKSSVKRKDLRKSIKPNNIKKKLIQRIKQHQQEKSSKRILNQNNQNESEEEKNFTKDFNDHLSYLEEIIQKKKKKRMKKKLRQQTKRRNPKIDVQPDPPYGCLKNGTKPTYSQYKKTLKMRNNPNSIKGPKLTQEVINPKPKVLINDNVIEPKLVPETNLREDKLARLKARLAIPKESKKERLVKVKKTIKKYRLGKNKKERVVGVLVKSGKTRKMVKDEHTILRKKCLSEIKQYLRKHNLIKIGSSAPEPVLRKLYEDSFLSGNVYNKNASNLIYNYLNDEE
jgi:hypothetical protein